VEKNAIKLNEEKIKHLFLPLQYNWLFKWLFFHWSIHHNKKPYLHYSKCYFINLALQYTFSIGAIKMRDESKKFLSYPFSFCFSSFLGDAFS